jgi:NAD(P)-dependent dehydrogenase (short-subunit alcohol dehydrogenase family)
MSAPGRVSIVTGGATGIGLSVVEALISRGGQAVIAGPSDRALDAAAERTGAAMVVGSRPWRTPP